MAYRLFQDYVLSPFLVSSGVDLHPLLLIFGVLAGEYPSGVLAMFLPIPALAMATIVSRRMRQASAARQWLRAARPTMASSPA